MKTQKYAFFLLLVLLFLTQSLWSQTVPKGMLIAGGNAGFQVVRAGGDSDALFFLNPSAGIFIINDLAIGGNVSITLTDNATRFGFGPFARFYFSPNVFAQSGFGFNTLKVRSFDLDGSLYVNLGIGYSIFLNRYVALEPILNLNLSDGQDVFGVNVGFQVFLGK